MSEAISEFVGLSLSKIGDLGVQVIPVNQTPAPTPERAAKDIEKAESKKPPGRLP